MTTELTARSTSAGIASLRAVSMEGARPSFPADSTSASRVVVKLSVGRTPFVVCDDKAIKESCFTTLSQREG